MAERTWARARGGVGEAHTLARSLARSLACAGASSARRRAGRAGDARRRRALARAGARVATLFWGDGQATAQAHARERLTRRARARGVARARRAYRRADRRVQGGVRPLRQGWRRVSQARHARPPVGGASAGTCTGAACTGNPFFFFFARARAGVGANTTRARASTPRAQQERGDVSKNFSLERFPSRGHPSRALSRGVRRPAHSAPRARGLHPPRVGHFYWLVNCSARAPPRVASRRRARDLPSLCADRTPAPPTAAPSPPRSWAPSCARSARTPLRPSCRT